MKITILFIALNLGLAQMQSTNINKDSHMGMLYHIVPNKQTDCKDDFPEQLSYFFEQIMGYGVKSEAEQVSKILKIDFAIFKDVQYDPSDVREANEHWHSIDSFLSVIDTIILKITAQPDFIKKVKHNQQRDKLENDVQKILSMKDTDEATRLLIELQKQPQNTYPPDTGYLKKGAFLRDLKGIRNTLECYKKQSVTKVRLEYM